jgi:acyl carrier protein
MSERQEAILKTVSELVCEVIGEDWIEDISIGMETSFSQDLELESIEFVALAERLQDVYGEQVDFVAWLSAMELDAIIGLSVGQLVEYIATCRIS